MMTCISDKIYEQIMHALRDGDKVERMEALKLLRLANADAVLRDIEFNDEGCALLRQQA